MPFSDDTLRRMRDFSAEAMGPLQEFLLRDIVRRIKGAGEITATAAYQIYRARALGESKRYLQKAIQRQLQASHKEIKRLYTEAARESYQIGTGRMDMPVPPWEASFGLQQVVAGAVELAQRDLTNITQTIGMVGPDGRALPLQQAYRRSMDFMFQKVSSGVQDYESALRDATRELADKGVRVIDYKSGRHASIETAARRCLMGGLGLLNERIEQHKREELGFDGWEISAHEASAPDHEPYQGRQYTNAAFMALNGTAERPGTLKRRIGTLNCTHYAFAVLLGVQAPVYSPEQLRAMAQANAEGITYRGKHYTAYQATQQQRRLEAAIRRQKLRCVVYEESGQGKQLLTAQIKLQQLRQEYKAFSKAAGLPEQNARQQVPGFGRGQAARARAAADAGGVTPEVARTVRRTLASAEEQYPELKGFVDRVQYKEPPGKAVAAAGLRRDLASGKVEASLTISPTLCADEKAIDAMVKANVSSGYWTPKDGLRGIVMHEVGHLVEYAKVLRRHGVDKNNPATDDLKAAWDDIRRHRLAAEILDEALKNCNLPHTDDIIVKELSIYAADDAGEALAEAVSSKSPGRLAKEMVRLLKQK